MEDLFEFDLDQNLDLVVDDAVGDLDFLPEDLFSFIDDDLHEDLKEIAESDVIPNIESLINFDEDDLIDDIQWNDDLDTTDFFKSIQQHIPTTSTISSTSVVEKTQQQTTAISSYKSSSNNKSSTNYNRKSTNKVSKCKQNEKVTKSTKQTKQTKISSKASFDTLSQTSTSPNSPTASYSTESSSSNDSTDFLDMFPNYYSLDSNNNLISHPISNLSNDEIEEIKLSSFAPQQQYQPSYSFDLSNNFGGFVNVQSALSLVNGAMQPKLVTSRRKKLSKGISLLANKPKSYKMIKKEKEMQQKQSFTKLTSKSSNTRQIETSNSSIQILPVNSVRKPMVKTQVVEQQIPQMTITTSIYAQDHDYCFNTLDNSLHA